MTIILRAKVEGLDEALRTVGNVGRQSRFAAAVSLTKAAKAIEQNLRAEMAAKLTSASPYSLRGTYSTSATKASLTAAVGIKDKAPARGTAPAKLLYEHFAGGQRGGKPMEVALSAIGVLPRGWRVVVGQGMPTDAYGNPKRQVVSEIIGALRTRMRVYRKQRTRQYEVGYFAVIPGTGSRLFPGIYKRTNNRDIKPMLMFVQAAGYRQRLDLPKIGEAYMDREFAALFRAEFEQAMRTAR